MRIFWGEKPAWSRWFFKLLSYFIAPFSYCIFNNANCIGVYHDRRIKNTFRETMECLDEGGKVIIFPEHNEPYNNIVWQFSDGFIDAAKMYYKRTGQKVAFVPMYISPELKGMYFGEPVYYDPESSLESERKRICRIMMERVSGIARSLPAHTIVPYPNLPKSEYPDNRGISPEPRRHVIPQPVVDYREFRLSKINEPRFSHIKLLGGWIVYFALYFITENLIPLEKCHVVHCELDDIIPFNEYFLIFYCSWYVLIVISLLGFFLYDIENFKRLQKYIMVTQAVAMVIYIVYPSVQLLRPETMPNDGFLCQVLSLIYAFDTPTGVCPSLHVAYSMGIASVWVKKEDAPKAWKIFVVALTVMISISVAFVKQHSVVDIAAAIPVGMIAEFIVYGKDGLILSKKFKNRIQGSSM